MKTKDDAFQMGVKLAQIVKDILELDLTTLNKELNHWETFGPVLYPTQYIEVRDLMGRMQQETRILLKAQHDLKQVKR